MGKTREKEELNIPVMIFFIIGAVLVVLGFLLLKNEDFKLKVISTQGVVSGTTTKQTADGTIESRTLNLTYTVSGNDYRATILNYSEELNIGDKMTLYYDLISPESVSNKREGYYGYIALIVGIILALKTGPRFVKIIKDNYL